MSLEDRIIELRRNGDFSACRIDAADGGYRLVLRGEGNGAERILTDDAGQEVLFPTVAEARATAYHCGLDVEDVHEPLWSAHRTK